MRNRKLNPTYKYGAVDTAPAAANIASAIDSTAKGDHVARRRCQNPEPFMNKTKQLWKATIAEYSRDSNGVERRKRKEITLGLTASMTLRDARSALQPILVKVNALAFNPVSEHKNITFEAFADIWKRDRLSKLKPSTQATMRGHIRLLKSFFGTKELRQIKAVDVRDFFLSLKDEDYKPKTKRNVWVTLRLIFSEAVIQEYVDHIPLKPKLPNGVREEVRWFSLQDVATIIREPDHDEPRNPLWWLAAETGIRAGEISALTPDDVKPDHITVRQSAWNGRMSTPKTSNGVRMIAISPQLFELLSPQVVRSRESKFLFPSRQDKQKPQDTGYFREMLTVRLKESKIAHAGLHAFRHFNASTLHALGVRTKVIQKRLGHASVRSTLVELGFDSNDTFTLDVYTHAEWQPNVDAAIRLGDAIEKAVNSVSLTAVQEKGPAGGVQQALTNQQLNGCGGQI